MCDDTRKCYICKKVLEADEGEEFFPYEVPGLENEELVVCSVCEQSPEHQSNDQTDTCNRAAEESYQEWCASQESDEE